MICDGKLKAYINLFFVTAKAKGLNLPEKVTLSVHGFCAQAVHDLNGGRVHNLCRWGLMMIFIFFLLNLCFASPPTR